MYHSMGKPLKFAMKMVRFGGNGAFHSGLRRLCCPGVIVLGGDCWQIILHVNANTKTCQPRCQTTG